MSVLDMILKSDGFSDAREEPTKKRRLVGIEENTVS
jgi:hypothetical protein